MIQQRLIAGLAIAIYLLMTLVVLYPMFVVQIPAFGDYLNHLARMHILADIGQSEALSHVYRLHWQAMPYLAMDAAFIVLNKVAPIYIAGRIFLAICIILPVVSVAILHFVVHRRISLVPTTAFLFCYNFVLAWGFLNYLFAACLAVILFAGWLATAGWRRLPRLALFCVLATILYLGHVVAFGAYGLMIVSYELAQSWRARFRPWRVIAADWTIAAMQAVPALGLALTVDLDRPFVGTLPTAFGGVSLKLLALCVPTMFFGGRADIIAGIVAGSVLVIGLRAGFLRLAGAVWPAALGLAAAAALMPSVLLGTYGMDLRLPLVVVLLLIGAASTTERMSPLMQGTVLATFLALTAVRVTEITGPLKDMDSQIADIRRVVATMPRGERLLVVDPEADLPTDLPWTRLHMSLVSVIDRDAFVPYLFTNFTTVRPVPSLRTSSTPTGTPLSPADLVDGLGRSDDPSRDEGDGRGRRIYWMGWENKFDYVLVQHFGHRPMDLPTNLVLVTASPVADLYRIDHRTNP